MAELHHLDISGLQAAFASGETTPTAVAEHYLDRIDRFDPALKAFIEVDRYRAMQAAAESDLRIDAAAPRALEGVPFSIKANIAVAGLEWNAGMALRRGLIAERDAAAVAALRDAGAIVFGTLNMEEAALGAATDNPWFGRGFNPHGQGRTPGGSSGGSGAAVAAGLCVAALGTDTLGSIRIPAAYNGVYGLKPTNGAVSNEGLVPCGVRLDTIGPLARSLDDLEAVMRALAPLGDAPAVERIVTLDGLAGVICEPAVVQGYERALAALGDLPRTQLALADQLRWIRGAGFVEATRDVIADLGADRVARRADIAPRLHALLDYGEARDAAKLERDAAMLARAKATLLEALPPGTALLMPTAPQIAFAQGTDAPINQADFCALANIAGLPALSLPSGRDGDGLPVAVQLVGAEGSEAALFALARRLDAALDAYSPPPGY